MGRSGIVLSFSKVVVEGINFGEVKVDIGGAAPITAMCFFPPGTSDWPLPGDTAALVQGPRSGEWVAVGFQDPNLAPPVTAPGERAIYSRSAPGVIAAKILLKADGSVDINDGQFVFANGTATAQTDFVSGTKSGATHTHGYTLPLHPSTPNTPTSGPQ